MDSHNFQRFVQAQSPTYAAALAELRAGRKRTHWMWFVFPQLHGLARTTKAKHFAIQSLDEARAYYEHPLLGSRLKECAEAVLAHSSLTAQELLGSPDDLKLRSCATLFTHATHDRVFTRILDQYYGGAPDLETLRRLKNTPSDP